MHRKNFGVGKKKQSLSASKMGPGLVEMDLMATIVEFMAVETALWTTKLFPYPISTMIFLQEVFY